MGLFFSLGTEINDSKLDIQGTTSNFKSVHFLGSFQLVFLVIKFDKSESFALISVTSNTGLLSIEFFKQVQELIFVSFKRQIGDEESGS